METKVCVVQSCLFLGKKQGFYFSTINGITGYYRDWRVSEVGHGHKSETEELLLPTTLNNETSNKIKSKHHRKSSKTEKHKVEKHKKHKKDENKKKRKRSEEHS